jgi:hypothetical protein
VKKGESIGKRADKRGTEKRGRNERKEKRWVAYRAAEMDAADA